MLILKKLFNHTALGSDEAPRHTEQNKKLFLRRWQYVLLALLGLFSLVMIIVGGLLFIPAFTNTYTVIPNVTTSHPIFRSQLQFTPFVILLDNFANENYSSFIASTTNAPSTSNISSKIWVARVMNVISKSYNIGSTILPSIPYDIHFYALSGSILNVTFSSLSGPDDASVLVELREFVGPGSNGSVLQHESVVPSTDSQSVIFTLEISGFVEIFITSAGVSGNFGYNMTIVEILLDGAEYVCTVNSTTTCHGMGVYDNNYIMAEITPESASIYPIATLTLVGKEKLNPTEANYSFILPAAVLISNGAVLCVVCLTLFVFLYCRLFKKCQ